MYLIDGSFLLNFALEITFIILLYFVVVMLKSNQNFNTANLLSSCAVSFIFCSFGLSLAFSSKVIQPILGKYTTLKQRRRLQIQILVHKVWVILLSKVVFRVVLFYLCYLFSPDHPDPTAILMLITFFKSYVVNSLSLESWHVSKR